ncbi:MAG: EamA family transporter [Candidatus Binatia bacterium]
MWAELAFAAGCLQTARNAFAKSLTGKVSPVLNSWARFTFNLPFSLLLVTILFVRYGWPQFSLAFFGCCLATAVTQLLGNVALVAAFHRANFAQSIVLHKLEVAFTAIIGMLFFAERPTILGWGGIGICSIGVLLMNFGREQGPAGWRRAFHLDAGALLALACAILLVLASFMLKAANTVFVAANPWVGADRFIASAYTLFHTVWIEVVILTLTLLFRRSTEFALVPVHWRRMALIGVTSFAASLCWFWSYSLTLVAYAKAVGQIEAILAIILALVVWKEREILRQLPGVGMVSAGIALVLLG